MAGAAYAQTTEPAQEGTDEGDQDVERIIREPLPSASLQLLADRLTARQRALDRRERDLAEREQDLRAAESRVNQRVAELTELREALEQQVGEVGELTEERIIGVVRMFEAMRSKDAAAVMTELSAEDGVRVLDRMNRTKAGKLLAAMHPVQAADLASRMSQPIELGAT
jgi:flagellar motility protein MotE (MotC chaperone)